MRTSLLLVAGLLAAAFSGTAQTVSDFENLTLPGTDTAYINYSNSHQDVGFNSGLAHFPSVYDTAYGGFWAYGFAYSNKKDSVKPGFAGQYNARTGAAFSGTNYVVGYGPSNDIRLLGAARGNNLSGLYVTNNNYAYYSMLNGDAFARKFGDTTGTGSGLAQGTYPDYYKMIFRGYRNGTLTTDSVEFYLADYRATNPAADYIVKDWKWVSLTSLGRVDSINIQLSSSDEGQFGINTPAYYCLDNFTTNETNLSTTTATVAPLKVYPNPATETLFVDAVNAIPETILVTDLSGKVMVSVQPTELKTTLNIGNWPSGMYQLQVTSVAGVATHRFVKP
ncbi:MAG: DUF4465 domain-containing protein [Sphingobacteriales bacterium]|nr:MAG: DUF4465 domain-containing protein [Sphingobacteriales bacterium]